MSRTLRIAPLVFLAAVVQVSAVAGTEFVGGEPDLLLLTIVAVALASGSVSGAVSGFCAGLLVDVMTLGTLGFMSLLLTLVGYWAGRYGETTGRGRAYAPSLTAFAMTVVVGLAATALHYLLGDAAVSSAAFVPLLPSAALAALLIIPVQRACRAVLDRATVATPSRGVELV